MEMPRKLTVSMLRVTVMILRDMEESVMEEKEEVRDKAGGLCLRRRWGLLLRDIILLESRKQISIDQLCLLG
jgi:hypothetical protein